jgi:ketosteroid isomerase-like protein
MSQENVNIVRESIEAYNRRDFDTAVQSFDTEIEWLFPPVLAGESGRGPEEVRRLWEGLDEAFEDFQLEPQEFVDAGGLGWSGLAFTAEAKKAGSRPREECTPSQPCGMGGLCERVPR